MILANLTLPRDFSVPIVVIWFGILCWICRALDQRKVEKYGVWEYQITGQFIQWWLGIDKPIPLPPRRGLERIRNGWTLIISTIVAIGLIVLIYATNPYMYSF